MSRQAKLSIPRSAVSGRFADIQKTFPLSAAEAKRLDAFLKGYNETQAAKKLDPSTGKLLTSKKKIKAKRKSALASAIGPD